MSSPHIIPTSHHAVGAVLESTSAISGQSARQRRAIRIVPGSWQAAHCLDCLVLGLFGLE